MKKLKEEFFQKGGKVEKLPTIDVKRKGEVGVLKKRRDYSQYDYSDASYPEQIKY